MEGICSAESCFGKDEQFGCKLHSSLSLPELMYYFWSDKIMVRHPKKKAVHTTFKLLICTKIQCSWIIDNNELARHIRSSTNEMPQFKAP